MSCIYIIRHKHSNNSYIGSTKDFRKRLWGHKTRCYSGNNKSNFQLYKFIRDNEGWDNFDMVKICDCEEDERLKMEQYYMDFVKPTLNNFRAYGLDIERQKINKREWNKKLNERRNEKLLCECGRYYTRKHKARHLKTNLHHRSFHHQYQNHQT